MQLSTVMVSLYQHVGLSSPSHTRLLILHSAQDQSAPLCGSLVEMDVISHDDDADDRTHERTKYEALSYVWGAPPSGSHLLHVVDSDGGRGSSSDCVSASTPSVLLITANCDAALRRLRRSSSSSPSRSPFVTDTAGDRALWVDSICIDQTMGGSHERNRQVNMMGDIYEGADDVLIWLGDGSKRTASLLRHLKRLYVLRNEFWEDVRTRVCDRYMAICGE